MDKEFPVHHMTIENIVKFIATPQNWIDVIGPKGYVLKNENMKDGKIESFDLFVANKNGLFDVDIHFKKIYITENSFQYDLELGDLENPDATFSVFWSFKMAHEHHIFSKKNHPSDTVIVRRLIKDFKQLRKFHIPYKGLLMVPIKAENKRIKKHFPRLHVYDDDAKGKGDASDVREWSLNEDDDEKEAKKRTAKVTPQSLTSNSKNGEDDDDMLDKDNNSLLSTDEIKNDEKGFIEKKSCCSKHACTKRRMMFLIFLICFYGMYLIICFVTPDKDNEKTVNFESFGGKIWRTVYGGNSDTSFELVLNAEVGDGYEDIRVGITADQYILLGDRHAGAILCWVISLFFDVFVVLMHLYFPAHPKFSLTKHHYISINMHVMSGAAECLTGGFIIFSEGTERIRLIYYMAMFSLVHVATAIYQTPIVFGTRR